MEALGLKSALLEAEDTVWVEGRFSGFLAMADRDKS